MNVNTYQLLSKDRKKLYKEISTMLEKESNKCTLARNFSDDDIIEVICRALLDTPNVFWLNSAIRTCTTGLRKEVRVSEIIPKSPSLDHMKSELKSKLLEICNSAMLRASNSDADKLLFIYKYLQDNTEYDKEAAESDVHPFSHTAYGSLVMKKSVCDGNAKAAILICSNLGIPCLGVSGALNGGGHSWVMVQCDQAWFHLDPTFRYYINEELDYSHWLQDDATVVQAGYQWNKSEYPVCNRRNNYVSKLNTSPIVSTESENTTLLRSVSSTQSKNMPSPSSANDIPESSNDYIQIESMSIYQSVLQKTFKEGVNCLNLTFSLSFGPIQEKTLIKLFERIAEKNIPSGIKYEYVFEKEKRRFSIRWE